MTRPRALMQIPIVIAVVLGLTLGWGIQLKADGGIGFSLIVSQGGTTKGGVVRLNCDGTTTTCTVAAGSVTIASIGGSSGITQLTGDVTAGPGSGSVAATVVNLSNVSNASLGTSGIANGAVTNVKLANSSMTISGVVCTLGGSCSPSGGGGGVNGWSGLPLTFLTNTTQYAPSVGGALTSTTETVVSLAAPATASYSNLSVSLSGALGISAGLTVTLENGTATPSTLTCATASGGTTCVDNTHSVSVTQGALLSFKMVSSGTVTAGLPQIIISYAIGTVTSGGGITQLTGDVTAGPGSGSVAASVVRVNGAAVPASAGTICTNASSQIVSSGCAAGGISYFNSALIPPTVGNWTQVGTVGTTLTAIPNGVGLSFFTTAGSSSSPTGWSIPTGVVANTTFSVYFPSVAENVSSANGIFCTNGNNTRALYWDSTLGLRLVSYQPFAPAAPPTFTGVIGSNIVLPQNPAWLRIQFTSAGGSTFWFGASGVDWVQAYSSSDTAFTSCGVMGFGAGSGSTVGLVALTSP